MPHALKPLDQQVVVITGASSEIGLATALVAAERGAKVVLVARNASVLEESSRKSSRAAATRCRWRPMSQTAMRWKISRGRR